MNKGYYDKKVLDGKRTAFYFDSLLDYYKFVDDTIPKLTGKALSAFNASFLTLEAVKARRGNKSWYGTDDAQSIVDKKTSFLFNNELKTFLQSLRNQTVNVDVIDIDQKKQIQFTEQEIGIFSFDLASLGLVRVNEYYSPLLKKVVDPYFIESYEVSDGKISFYHIKVNYIPKHIVKYSATYNGLFSPILNRVVDFSEVIQEVDDNDIIYYFPEVQEIPRHDVEVKQMKNEDGSLKFSTTYKKCFINVPRVKNNLPRIDLIISASYSGNVDAEKEMIWNTMAMIAIAEKLTSSGINYRILASYTTRTSGGRQNSDNKDVYCFVKIKGEEEPLDINLTATLISDPRFLRFDDFKCNLSAMFEAGYNDLITNSIGGTINDTVYGDEISYNYNTFKRNDVDNFYYSTGNSGQYLDENGNLFDKATNSFVNNIKTRTNVFNSSIPVKVAYIDYLKTNTSESDQEAAKNPNSKINFKQVLSEKQAIDEYNRVIKKISKLS